MRLLPFSIVSLLLWSARSSAGIEGFLTDLNALRPPEREQKLIEAAKKEGEVTLHSSSGLEEVRAITELVAKKDPLHPHPRQEVGGPEWSEPRL